MLGLEMCTTVPRSKTVPVPVPVVKSNLNYTSPHHTTPPLFFPFSCNCPIFSWRNIDGIDPWVLPWSFCRHAILTEGLPPSSESFRGNTDSMYFIVLLKMKTLNPWETNSERSASSWRCTGLPLYFPNAGQHHELCVIHLQGCGVIPFF